MLDSNLEHLVTQLFQAAIIRIIVSRMLRPMCVMFLSCKELWCANKLCVWWLNVPPIIGMSIRYMYITFVYVEAKTILSISLSTSSRNDTQIDMTMGEKSMFTIISLFFCFLKSASTFHSSIMAKQRVWK